MVQAEPVEGSVLDVQTLALDDEGHDLLAPFGMGLSDHRRLQHRLSDRIIIRGRTVEAVASPPPDEALQKRRTRRRPVVRRVRSGKARGAKRDSSTWVRPRTPAAWIARVSSVTWQVKSCGGYGRRPPRSASASSAMPRHLSCHPSSCFHSLPRHARMFHHGPWAGGVPARSSRRPPTPKSRRRRVLARTDAIWRPFSGNLVKVSRRTG